MDLATGALGPEAKYDIAFQDKKLVITINYTGKDLGASMSISVDSTELVEKLASYVGLADNPAIALIKAAL